MAITRPIGEQINFTSSKTGTHILDTYLEACEFNDRKIYDLMADIWDTSTGLVDSDKFQVRIVSATRQLQTRMGTFADPAASWTDVDDGFIFRQKGAHANATAYEQLDVVTYNNGTYVCITAHTSSAATPSGTNFATILDGTALGTATTSATASATTATTQAGTATTQATAAAASATLASEWAEKTPGAVTGTSYSAKYWATQADVGTVATNITNINAVAGKVTEIGLLGTSAAIADMAILGTSAVVTDMDILGTAANVTAMGHLGTAAVVADMAILGTADVVTDMNTLASATTVTNMNLLGTSAVVTDMGILATADVVSDMNTLATPDIVTDMNTLGSAAIVEDMSILGTSAVVADMAILATADVVADMNTLGSAAIVTDMDILGTPANVTAMGTLGTATNVTNMASVAANITGVNSFADKYRVQASAPSSSLDEGDLWYDTTNDAMKVYDGSSFVTSAGFASFATTDMTDVAISSIADNDILAWNSGTSKWTNQTPAEASIDVSDLADTTITSVADNEILAYDNGSSSWINQTAAEAGLEPANANIQSHIADADKHREIDDAATGTTDLWSASKINTQIAAVPDAIVMAIALG